MRVKEQDCTKSCQAHIIGMVHMLIPNTSLRIHEGKTKGWYPEVEDADWIIHRMQQIL
jgi:hypothetical protein